MVDTFINKSALKTDSISDIISNKKQWKTARGTLMNPEQMSSNHIINCIRCLKGTGNSIIPDDRNHNDWIDIFSMELIKRK